MGLGDKEYVDFICTTLIPKKKKKKETNKANMTKW